jgi:hypothetical protein
MPIASDFASFLLCICTTAAAAALPCSNDFHAALGYCPANLENSSAGLTVGKRKRPDSSGKVAMQLSTD